MQGRKLRNHESVSYPWSMRKMRKKPDLGRYGLKVFIGSHREIWYYS